MADPIDVFISSTCYDLADLRAELTEFLTSRGLRVRVSEDPKSAFYVDATGDSIASCLKNVETSRAVVVIIDRRYGRLLPAEYGGVSATEAEVTHAQKLGKPVLFFIRNVALVEYRQMRRTPAFDPEWVDARNKEPWLKFVDEQFKLPAHQDHSNWYDEFKNSVDLKQLVMIRLVQQFPEYAGTNAMNPDRLVRMTFRPHATSWANVRGTFRNVGTGAALKVRHGISEGFALYPGIGIEFGVHEMGGLREGEYATDIDGAPFVYDLQRVASGRPAKLFCQYQNRFGDQYRVEIQLVQRNDDKAWIIEGDEKLAVRSKMRGFAEWILQDA